MKQLNNSWSLKSKLCSSMMLFASLFATESKAQSFVPAINSQTMYPTTGTTALNLDVANTKYLSNFSFPGSGPLTGSTIEVAGWSTSTDGGFSYGLAMAAPPYTYTGKGAMAIPNAIDVQVGYMEQGGNSYIVASYYDVVKRNYAYDLYSFAFTPPSTITVTKLYTYVLRNPDIPYACL